ncbi:uncharacterized protein LOC121415916 [Lytechinus variegatus]|uniref:uncharacterized protein LOC121415916 n=1 Tax=Lytechinus variegatus TaxID=7654 RepID=UPI001BB10F6E|nr:uncharacterized protein LOC121415916 [Lytechinus variegatus]
MAPSVIAVSAVNTAATQPHFVSVLMCSGPHSGKVFAVLVQDLVHRRKKLDIGTHVLVKRHDGSKRVKGVVVHMNPFLNAGLPPAKAKAVPVPNLPRQQPAKRPCMPEQPSLADDVAVRAAKRSKPGPSQPNGVSALQPALLQMGPHGTVFIRCFNQEPEPPCRRIFGPQSTRYPTRHRVRRELVYGKTSMKLKGSSQPVSVEELDGIVPLDCLDDIVSVNELCEALTQAREEAVSIVGPLHSTPISAPPPSLSDAPSITPYFKGEFQPLRPAPYSRNLFEAEPRVERHADQRLNDGLYPASFLGSRMSSPRMA